MPDHTKCCTCHAKSSAQNWRSHAPNATLLRKSAPWPPNSSDEHVSCTAPATENASLQILFKCPHACHRLWKCCKTLLFCSLLTRCIIPCACHAKRHLNVQKYSEPVSALHFWLRNVLRATMACTCSTSQLPKVVRTWCVLCFTPQRRALFHHLNFQKWSETWCVLYILTSKCASRHNGVHFSIISTPQKWSEHGVFCTFWFQMCFAPQRRALFRHLNSQKWSEHGVFCTFWLPNVFRTTTACTFSTSQLPKVVWAWCVWHILN